jgi:hypothetical protein
MHQRLGGLVEIPLQMANQARAIIDDAQQHRLGPGAGPREYRAAGMMEIQMPKGADVIDLEAPDLQSFEPVAGQ